MAAEAITEIDEEEDDNPIPSAPVPPVRSEPVKATVAADFVAADTDRPRADENAPSPLLPPDEPPSPAPSGVGGARPGAGRPRKDKVSKEGLRSRERYARMKAERDGPPSFADLPGGSPPPGAVATPPPIPGAKPVNYRMNAEICFSMVTGAMTMMLSDEWQPQNNSEKDQVVDSLARYMESKNWSDLTPGWALAVVSTFYVMPRLSMPKTKEKLAKLVKKLKREENSDVSRL